ncbi:hypothetical protein CYMTET_49611 [Cymbomonas tetramitiformis]|uniref:Protein kinase domain-containing protein n=1 Tax=Cymbomonas tetramitiformis TaxID=36881 RepID=A0AAE0BR64_9CHLO|nr:hypothetical protein CYMTET_49611 [Cymbomonas tetramitiformis]
MAQMGTSYDAVDKENVIPSEGLAGKAAVPSRAAVKKTVTGPLRIPQQFVTPSLQKVTSFPENPATPSQQKKSSWETDLALYLQQTNTTPPQVSSERSRLTAALRASPESSSTWLAFLEHEGRSNAERSQKTRGGVTLFRLYEWATKTIPRHGNRENETYVRIWLGYIKEQALTEEEEARVTYKFLKSQRIGERCACFYCEWADFEVATGNPDKAQSILGKGLQMGAEPRLDLERAEEVLQGGAASAPKLPSPDGAPASGSASRSSGTSQHSQDTPCGGPARVQGASSSDASPPAECSEEDVTIQCPAGAVRLRPTVRNMQAPAPSEPPHEGPTVALTRPSLRDRTSTHSITQPSQDDGAGGRQSALEGLSGRLAPAGNGPPLASAADDVVISKMAKVEVSSLPEKSSSPAGGSSSSAEEDETVCLAQVTGGTDNDTKPKAGGGGPAKRFGLGLSGRASRLGGPARRIPSAFQVAAAAGAAESIAADAAGEASLKRKEQPMSAAGVGENSKRRAVTPPGGKSGPAAEDDDPTVPLLEVAAAPAAARRAALGIPAAGGAPPATGAGASAATCGGRGEASDMDGEETQPLQRPGSTAAPQGLTPVHGRVHSAMANGTSGTAAKAATPAPAAASEEDATVALAGPAAAKLAAKRAIAAEGQAPATKQGEGKAAAASEAPRGAAAQSQDSKALDAKLQGKARGRVREDNVSVSVCGVRYTKLECIGQGGSSKVFKVMAPNKKIYALKRIRLTGREGHDAVSGFEEEIKLLDRLKGCHNIVQLVDFEIIRGEGVIYMLLEYGEIDLARLLQKHEKARKAQGMRGKEAAGATVDENFIRCHWQEMLEAVHTIHEARIVHSDLKPANFLFVERTLKLIDFGIAKAINNDTTNIVRDGQVGTVNYMSPEAILNGQMGADGTKVKVGRPSDIWSLGCILYQMVYGCTPFHNVQGLVQKLHAITDAKFEIEYADVSNKSLISTIKACLARDPRDRITIPQLLEHPFLRPSAKAGRSGGASPAPGISESQLRRLLGQLALPGSSVQGMSQEVFRQLESGETLDLSSFLANAGGSKAPTAPPPPPPPPPPPAALPPTVATSALLVPASTSAAASSDPPPASVTGASSAKAMSVAEEAAAMLSQRSSMRTAALAAMEQKKLANKPDNMVLQEDILKMQSKLRPVSDRPEKPLAKSGGGGLQDALVQGLARFHTPEDADIGGNTQSFTDTFHWNNS